MARGAYSTQKKYKSHSRTEDLSLEYKEWVAVGRNVSTVASKHPPLAALSSAYKLAREDEQSEYPSDKTYGPVEGYRNADKGKDMQDLSGSAEGLIQNMQDGSLEALDIIARNVDTSGGSLINGWKLAVVYGYISAGSVPLAWYIDGGAHKAIANQSIDRNTFPLTESKFTDEQLAFLGRDVEEDEDEEQKDEEDKFLERKEGDGSAYGPIESE